MAKDFFEVFPTLKLSDESGDKVFAILDLTEINSTITIDTSSNMQIY